MTSKDADEAVLRMASAAVFRIDLRFMRTDINGKHDLRESRNDAFSAFRVARDQLIAAAVICDDKDVENMKKIKEEIDNAADIQTLIRGILKFINFLTGL